MGDVSVYQGCINGAGGDGSVEDAHTLGWKVCRDYVDQFLPVFGANSTAELPEILPNLMSDWLEKCWAHIGNGIRRRNLEHLVLWCRLETLGVLTASQVDWLQGFVTKALWEYK